MGVEEIQKINCYIGGIIVKIKTKDYIICGNYGQGWEEVDTRTTLSEGKQILKDYNENEKEYNHKLKIKWSK